jgi:hypothetical protein
MKSHFNNKLLLLIIICAVKISFSQEFQGFVKTDDDKPLKDVSVNAAKTDEKGFFETTAHKGFSTVQDGKGVLYFEKAGYISQSKTVDGSTGEILIKLREANPKDKLTIGNCGNLSGKIVGNVLNLIVPKGSGKKSGFDVDYGYYTISFGKAENYQYLRGIYQMFPKSNPNPDWIKNSKNIEFKWWQNDSGITGVSWTGETVSGKFWRYFAFDFMGSEIVEYLVDSKEAADYFDRIIEGGCIKIPNWTKKK